jgi:hypothetical protein
MMIEDFLLFIQSLNWVQICVCTVVLGIAYFIYLYKTRGNEFLREMCGKTHTYGGDGRCMVCGERDPTSPKEGEE